MVCAAWGMLLHRSDNCINGHNVYADSPLGRPHYYGATSGAELWHTYGGCDSLFAASIGSSSAAENLSLLSLNQPGSVM